MIYLDTSALVKLVFEEAESRSLARWLEASPEVPKMSSEVAAIELVRACRRIDEEAVPSARQVLGGLDLIPLSGDVVDRAALLPPVDLRSLDAVHLASAITVSESLSSFVVYDTRLKTAAEAAGLNVVAPE